MKPNWKEAFETNQRVLLDLLSKHSEESMRILVRGCEKIERMERMLAYCKESFSRIAYEPQGPADAPHVSVLDAVTEIAIKALTRLEHLDVLTPEDFKAGCFPNPINLSQRSA